MSLAANARVPQIAIDIDDSQAGARGGAKRTLIVGQLLAAGTWVANTAVRVSSAAQAKTGAGVGSVLSSMCSRYLANDASGEVWAMGLADVGGGTAATGVITPTGPSTAAGTLHFRIGGYYVAVAVASGASVATMCTSIAAAISAATYLPVTAVATSTVVNLTARHKGTVGNAVSLKVNYSAQFGSAQELPAGVGISFTAMNSGASDPSVTAAIAAMGDVEYDYVIVGLCDTTTLAAFKAEADRRWGATTKVYGQVFTAKQDTLSNLQAFWSAGSTGKGLVHVLDVEPGVPTPFYEVAAMAGGQIAGTLRAHPARPEQTLQIVGMLPSPTPFTAVERQTLLTSGIGTQRTPSPGAAPVLERWVSTHTTDANGGESVAWLDVQVAATLAEVLRRFGARISKDFPRAILIDDGQVVSNGPDGLPISVATTGAIGASLDDEYEIMAGQGLVEDVAGFKAARTVTRHPTDRNRVVISFDPNLANQLRIVDALARFLI